MPVSSEWKLWSGWTGSPTLLAHVMRVCIRRLNDAVESRPGCKVSVRVGDDTEWFESPSDFRENVTDEALSKFSSLRLQVGDLEEGMVASLSIAREADPDRGWLKGAVLAQVTARPTFAEAIREVNDGMVAAVKRGTKRASEIASGREEASTVDACDNAPRPSLVQWEKKQQRALRYSIVGAAITLILFGGLWAYSLMSGTADAVSGAVGFGGTVACGVIGGLIGSAASYFFPSFEIADQSRAARARGLARPILGAVAGAGIGIARLVS